MTVVAEGRRRTLDDAERLALAHHLEQPEVDLHVDLHRGQAGTHLYFSDLTHQYVTLNAEYTT